MNTDISPSETTLIGELVCNFESRCDSLWPPPLHFLVRTRNLAKYQKARGESWRDFLFLFEYPAILVNSNILQPPALVVVEKDAFLFQYISEKLVLITTQ